jgi:hypothetical protein
LVDLILKTSCALWHVFFIDLINFISDFETFEKCSILFKFKSPARGAYAPEGKANPPPNFGGLTTGIHLVF